MSGQSLTLNSTAATCTNPEYKVYHLAPGGAAWEVLGEYSPTNAQYVWNSSGAAVGAHAFEVWVRTQASSQDWQAYSQFNIAVTAP